MNRRVVVTGLGMVTPVGRDAKATWAALQESGSGVGPITRFDAATFPTRIAAEVKDFRLDEYLKEEHSLLTPREKIVLTRRFHLNNEAPKTETLEQVGRDLGLSKEWVRQVQMSAFGKLRDALLSRTSAS